MLLAYISIESKLDYLTIINTIPHVYLIEPSKMICVRGGLLCEYHKIKHTWLCTFFGRRRHILSDKYEDLESFYYSRQSLMQKYQKIKNTVNILFIVC